MLLVAKGSLIELGSSSFTVDQIWTQPESWQKAVQNPGMAEL